jgi:hypothetical protein
MSLGITGAPSGPVTTGAADGAGSELSAVVGTGPSEMSTAPSMSFGLWRRRRGARAPRCAQLGLALLGACPGHGTHWYRVAGGKAQHACISVSPTHTLYRNGIAILRAYMSTLIVHRVTLDRHGWSRHSVPGRRRGLLSSLRCGSGCSGRCGALMGLDCVVM